MGTRHYGGGESAGNGDAFIEAAQFQGNLALVVIHCHHSIELSAEGLDEGDVTGIGTGCIDPHLSCLGNSGFNDINFLTPAQAMLAGMGVQGSQCKPGLCNAAVLQGCVCQSHCTKDSINGEVLADFGNRDMAGGSGGPQVPKHVDLPKGFGMVEELGKIVMFAFQLTSGFLHACLVEGSEAEAFNFFGLIELNTKFQSMQVCFSCFNGQLPKHNLLGILIVLVKNSQITVPINLVDIRNHLQGY